jgi:hypothetical protein
MEGFKTVPSTGTTRPLHSTSLISTRLDFTPFNVDRSTRFDTILIYSNSLDFTLTRFDPILFHSNSLDSILPHSNSVTLLN